MLFGSLLPVILEGHAWASIKGEIGIGLTSMIRDGECFGIFFIRVLRVKGYYDVMIYNKSF